MGSNIRHPGQSTPHPSMTPASVKKMRKCTCTEQNRCKSIACYDVKKRYITYQVKRSISFMWIEPWVHHAVIYKMLDLFNNTKKKKKNTSSTACGQYAYNLFILTIKPVNCH